MLKLFTGKWIFRHILVLLVAVILANFGFWQVRRLDEKRNHNADIRASLAETPLQLDGQQPATPETLHFRRVQVRGEFDNAESMVLRNRSFNNQPGVHLLTPLKLQNSDQAVLVDRGWLPRALSDPESRAEYAVTGPVTVEGIAYQTQTRPSSLAPLDKVPDGESRLDAWFRVDIEMIQAQLPYPLLPVFITQSPGPDNTADTLPQPAGNVELDEGPHLSYAIQWFSFAVVLLIIYGYFIRQELKKAEEP